MPWPHLDRSGLLSPSLPDPSDPATPEGEPYGRNRRCGDPFVAVIHDVPEARRVGLPVFAGLNDLFVRARDEVPLHHDVVFEGLAAEQEHRRA